MAETYCDLCVIGGGINGAGVARDAAGRGLSVVLLEAKDLAQGTSSASTKLIHGGLRYLEYYDFKLVRESLLERERLLRMAPHIIWPMEFVLPHDTNQRPYNLIRAGLFLYDHLAPRKILAGSKALKLKNDSRGGPLKPIYEKGFAYSDCWAEDSRLVVLNAMDAHERGAEIKTRSPCVKLQKQDNHWHVGYADEQGGEHRLRAKMVINAAGPWAYDVLKQSGLASPTVPKLKLVKGSHIIAKKAYEGEHAYILQQADKRIVFAIPYERDYTLIGTTEEEYKGDVYEAQISNDEIDYLIAAYNASFQTPIAKSDVLWTYSGVRPLFDGGDDAMTSSSRDFKLHVHDKDAPMLSIFGGKLTTYRVVAEKAVDKVLGLKGKAAEHWSADEPLPGGKMKEADFEAFYNQLSGRYFWLPQDVVQRYARAYGTRAHDILGDSVNTEDLGAHYGDGVYEAEIRYLIEKEWARSAEDILWRRSKLGLHISEDTLQTFDKALPDLLKQEQE